MKSGMKIALVVIGIIVVVIVAGCQFYAGNYNKMVTLDEQVSNQWAQVQNVYQRRYDLIPNLVETVKGFASHESQVLTDVAEARSKAGGVMQLSAADLDDPEKLRQFQEAQNSNIIANMSGFRTKEKFTADSAAQSAPVVSFD